MRMGSERGWRALSAPVLDTGLAAVVAAVVCVVIHVAHEPGVHPTPDGLAYLLGAAVGAVLLGRRRWPLAVLGATAGLLFVYYALGYPGFEPALPLAVALYTAAAAGYLWWGVGVAGFYLAAELIVSGIRLGSPLLPLLTVFVQDAALVGVVILAGALVRSRRQRLADADARLAEAQAGREREAAARVVEERLRIAREVHDVLGHSLSVVLVQAGLAQDVLDDHPAQARTALQITVDTARHAMAELKTTLALLRTDDIGAAGHPGVAVDGRSPRPSLGQLAALVAVTDRSGLRVTVNQLDPPRPLPALVDLSAYRIVQEALTNIARHAEATDATVTIRRTATMLEIDVTDNGRGPVPAAGPAGYGILGMAERAHALGGSLEAGAASGGGFGVHARLPIGPS